MPLDLQLGATIPIPCRSCGQAFIPFKLAAGPHRLTCPRCGEVTIVTAALDEDERWRIRTAAERVETSATPRK